MFSCVPSFYLLYFSHIVGKTVLPKSANEVKLISSGKILENNKTVGQCKAPFGDIAGGVIIMHVVVQPSLAKSKAGKFHNFLLGMHLSLATLTWKVSAFVFNLLLCLLFGMKIRPGSLQNQLLHVSSWI